MYANRPQNRRIDSYAGPYERWVFSQELGRPYAFPAISTGTSKYFTALLEGGEALPVGDGIKTRTPPLWNPIGSPRAVTPFAFYDPHADGVPEPDDNHIGQLLENGLGPRYRVNFPITKTAWTKKYKPDDAMENWVPPTTAPKAIVAVIDDGIPFAHQAFLDAAGRSRISHIWLQSAEAKTEAAVPFGRELVNSKIDTLRTNAGGDEDRVYRSAKAIDPDMPELGHHLRRHATHGSHVAGMCAGNDPRLSSHPMGDDVQIIAVQLPNTIAWDTSGFGKEMYMLSALHYIFDRARAIAAHYAADPADPQELPLIVNFSYGWSASRHDGGSEMELAIEELLSERKTLQPATAIVMPSGNNFSNDMHGQITDANMVGGSYDFGWQVLPDDRTSSYLELWLPEDLDPAGYSAHVTPPAGSALAMGGQIDISADPDLEHGDPRRFTELEMDGQNIGQLSVDQHRGNRWRVMLALIPTVYMSGQNRRAPAGMWKVEVRQNAGQALRPDQQINVWVQRDDDPASLRTGGKQSRLVDLAPDTTPKHPLKHYTHGLGFVRGFGCMNGVGSAPSVTRVAGYVHGTGRPCLYSGSSGLTLNADGTTIPWGADTTISAVGDQSMALGGTRSIGVRSGSGTRLSGTSGAAPAVSRLMAINAAAGRDLTSGLDGRLPIDVVEDTTGIIPDKHVASTGATTAPLVGRAAPTLTSGIGMV